MENEKNQTQNNSQLQNNSKSSIKEKKTKKFTHSVRLQKIEQEKKARSKIDQEIAKLRQQKREAIRHKDYDTAEEIDRQIVVLNNNFDMELVLKAEEEFRQKADEIVRIYITKFQEVDEILIQQQKQVRVRINASFEEMRKQHQEELINLEKEHANNRLREQLRPIPAVITLNQQAEHAATVGNYDGARAFRDEAENMQQSDVEKRLRRVDEAFEVQSDTIINSQRQQLLLLSQKLISELQAFEEQAQHKHKQLLQNREAALIAHFNTSGQNSERYEAILAQVCYDYGIPPPRGIGSSAPAKKEITKSLMQSYQD